MTTAPTTAPTTALPGQEPDDMTGATPQDPTARPGESEFLAGYDPHKYPPFAVTCDIVELTVRHGALSVLLVQRAEPPFQGRWALPGGFVNIDEDIAAAAARELREETGLDTSVAHLEQLGTYGAPNRDPRMRVVSVAHLALLPEPGTPERGSDAADARFWRVEDVTEDMLAFDHAQILADAVERARAKLEYTPLATAFIDAEFTLGELQAVYEAVWGTHLHRSNFRRKVLSTPGFVEAVDGVRDGAATGGRPATLYKAGGASLLHPALMRPEPDPED